MVCLFGNRRRVRSPHPPTQACLDIRATADSSIVSAYHQCLLTLLAACLSADIPKDSDNWFAEWFPSAQKATKIVCFVNADYLTSPWCMKEFRVAEGLGKLLVVACEPISDIMQVDASQYPHASNALAYFLAGGQAICPDGQVFGGEEDVVQKIIAFR